MENANLVDQVIDGKYTVLEIIGSGAMGSVAKARQSGLSRLVALKFLHPYFLGSTESRSRFVREAHALSSLSHKNICAFYHFGIWRQEHNNSATPYIAMEYLQGKSLQELLGQGPIPWQRTLRIAIQIAEAMEHVHSANILHRDLKPSNIYLLAEPEQDFVKVVDFGLAKILCGDGPEQGKLTMTGELVGTVLYMSPELCAGHKPDNRSDIYSLGAMIYECIVGQPPFQGDDPIAVIFKHINEEPLLPSSCLSYGNTSLPLPFGFDAVIMKTLAKDANKRYQSMGEFKADLLKLEQGIGETCDAVLNSKGDTEKQTKNKIGNTFSMAITLAALVLAALLLFFTCTGPGLLLLQKIIKPNAEQYRQIIAELECLHCFEDAQSTRENFLQSIQSAGQAEQSAELCYEFARENSSKKRGTEENWLRKGFKILAGKYKSDGQLGSAGHSTLNALSSLSISDLKPSGLLEMQEFICPLSVPPIRHKSEALQWLPFVKLQYLAASQSSRGMISFFDAASERLSECYFFTGQHAESSRLQAEVRRLCLKRFGKGKAYADFLLNKIALLSQSKKNTRAERLFQLKELGLLAQNCDLDLTQLMRGLEDSVSADNSFDEEYFARKLEAFVDISSLAPHDDKNALEKRKRLLDANSTLFALHALADYYTHEKLYTRNLALLPPILKTTRLQNLPGLSHSSKTASESLIGFGSLENLEPGQQEENEYIGLLIWLSESYLTALCSTDKFDKATEIVTDDLQAKLPADCCAATARIPLAVWYADYCLKARRYDTVLIMLAGLKTKTDLLRNPPSENQCDYWRILASVQEAKHNYEEAVEAYLRALKIAEQLSLPISHHQNMLNVLTEAEWKMTTEQRARHEDEISAAFRRVLAYPNTSKGWNDKRNFDSLAHFRICTHNQDLREQNRTSKTIASLTAEAFQRIMGRSPSQQERSNLAAKINDLSDSSVRCLFWQLSHRPDYRKSLNKFNKQERIAHLCRQLAGEDLDPDESPSWRNSIMSSSPTKQDLVIMDIILSKEFGEHNGLVYPASILRLVSSFDYEVDGCKAYQLAHFAYALQSLNKAIALGSQSAEVYFCLALCYCRQGKEDLARSCFDKAIKIDPLYDQIYVERGLWSLEHGDKKACLVDLSKAKALKTDDDRCYTTLKKLTNSNRSKSTSSNELSYAKGPQKS